MISLRVQQICYYPPIICVYIAIFEVLIKLTAPILSTIYVQLINLDDNLALIVIHLEPTQIDLLNSAVKMSKICVILKRETFFTVRF